MKDWK